MEYEEWRRDGLTGHASRRSGILSGLQICLQVSDKIVEFLQDVKSNKYTIHLIFNIRSVRMLPLSGFHHFLSNDTDPPVYRIRITSLDSSRSPATGIMKAVVLKRIKANSSGGAAFACP